jgi:hypothetical protein
MPLGVMAAGSNDPRRFRLTGDRARYWAGWRFRKRRRRFTLPAHSKIASARLNAGIRWRSWSAAGSNAPRRFGLNCSKISTKPSEPKAPSSVHSAGELSKIASGIRGGSLSHSRVALVARVVRSSNIA